jgi:ribulose bisphosphate carboxylase small subunit
MKYAVLFPEQVYHEGDERSRTNPGHGYPAYTETVEKMKEFDSLDQLKAWIRVNHGNKKIRVIEFQDVEYTTELKVDIKRPPVTRSSTHP